MHTQQLIRRQHEAASREKEQAIRLAKVAGVANPKERVEPELTATVRYGDPNLAALFEKEARIELVEEALTKLEAGDVDTSDAPVTSLEELEGVGPEMAEKLETIGIHTVEDLRDADEEVLMGLEGVGKAKAKKLKEAATGKEGE